MTADVSRYKSTNSAVVKESGWESIKSTKYLWSVQGLGTNKQLAKIMWMSNVTKAFDVGYYCVSDMLVKFNFKV